MIDQLRGIPLSMIETLEEFIEDNHAIVYYAFDLNYYSLIVSLKCAIILNNKDHTIVDVLENDVDPLIFRPIIYF